MRGWSWIVVALSILAALRGPGTVATALAQDSCPAQLEQLRAENARLQARIAELEGRVQQVQGEKRDLEIVAGVTPAKDGERIEERLQAGLVTGVEDEKTTFATPYAALETTRGSRADHWLRFVASRASGSAARIQMQIATKGSSGVYRGVGTASFEADGEVIECAVVDYGRRRTTGGVARKPLRREDETVTIALTPADLARLAAAAQVQGRMGSVRFTFPQEARAAARVMQAALAQGD